MTTTLILIGLIFAACVVAVWAYDRLLQISRRRDRDIVRRIQRYLDSIPPARPW